MADPNHSYSRTPNTLPELEGTMRGVYHSRGLVSADELAQQTASANPDIGSPEKVKMVMRALMGEVAGHVAKNRRVQMPEVGVTFGLGLDGSLPSLDADPGEDNHLYTGIYLDESWRRPFDGVVPELIGPTADEPYLDSEEDARTFERNVVDGTNPFIFVGFNLSAEVEGEGVTLEYSNGATYAAEVTEVLGTQRVIARFTTPPPAGKAVLKLMTRGALTPQGSLWSLTRKVTVLAGDAPVPPVGAPDIERGYSVGHGEGEDDGKVFPGTGFVLIGSGFANALVKITYSIAGQPSDVDVDPEDMTVTDTGVTIDAASPALQEAIQATGTLTFTVTTSAGSDTYDAVVLE